VNLPTALLSFGLLITISSILINTKFGFIMGCIISSTLIVLFYFQINDILPPANYWLTEKLYVSDVVQYSIILLIMAIVSWLSNRETERSLIRARDSGAALKQERDLLEIKVGERTKEIKELQIQRVSELYHLAEAGKLATGIFHDLMNPLTALTLAVEQIKPDNNTKISQLSDQTRKALVASRKAADFISVIRRYSTLSNKPELTDLSSELERIIKLLDYKAKRNGIEFVIDISPDITTVIIPSFFYHIAHNLISASIDHCIVSSAPYPILNVLLQSKGSVIHFSLRFLSDDDQYDALEEDSTRMEITKYIIGKLNG
jgi:signal transduction histidine kinase